MYNGFGKGELTVRYTEFTGTVTVQCTTALARANLR